MLGNVMRRHLSRTLAGQSDLVLGNSTPTRDDLEQRFDDIDELGLYLHVPFCRQICPYCPYNKELFRPEMARQYATAVIKEIDYYADLVGRRPVTSLYVGGGTPTTMLHFGLADILDHVHKRFNVRCDIHMESHVNDLSEDNLNVIQSLQVQHLSTGVEAMQDKHLRFLKRPYLVDDATRAVQRALQRNFKCVNVDLMFALPGQTRSEVAQAATALVELGVDQVATYPLFRFPYTVMGGDGTPGNYGPGIVLKRRRMLKTLERVFYSAGYRRSSVWAFTRTGVPRYCSVTVPLYLGLGASGGTYLRDVFYLNTFSVAEYVKAIAEKGTAIALSLDLTKRMQMAGWLYWRIYETSFDKSDFLKRFGQPFDEAYGKYFALLRRLRFTKHDGDRIVLTDRGSYWLHALEDVLSIDYISRLWGTSKQQPWPKTVPL